MANSNYCYVVFYNPRGLLPSLWSKVRRFYYGISYWKRFSKYPASHVAFVFDGNVYFRKNGIITFCKLESWKKYHSVEIGSKIRLSIDQTASLIEYCFKNSFKDISIIQFIIGALFAIDYLKFEKIEDKEQIDLPQLYAILKG